jgi:hypothetical protein
MAQHIKGLPPQGQLLAALEDYAAGQVESESVEAQNSGSRTRHASTSPISEQEEATSIDAGVQQISEVFRGGSGGGLVRVNPVRAGRHPFI